MLQPPLMPVNRDRDKNGAYGSQRHAQWDGADLPSPKAARRAARIAAAVRSRLINDAITMPAIASWPGHR